MQLLTRINFPTTDRLLLINDLINNVNARHESFKKGDFTAKVTIDPSIDPSKGGADAVPTAKITDLISFDDEESKVNTSSAGGNQSSVLDDFASLSFGAPTAQSASTKNTATSTTSTTTSSLPLDLFDSDNQSTGPMTAAGAPLGNWGALQLPMNGTLNKSSNGSNTTMQTQPNRAQAGPSITQTTSDPFADLSKW